MQHNHLSVATLIKAPRKTKFSLEFRRAEYCPSAVGMACRDFTGCILRLLGARILHQSIANRGFGQNVPRLRRIGLELLTQVAHIYPHIVAIFRMRRTPDLAQNLPMSQHLPGVGNQEAQQPVFDRRQMYRSTAFVHGSQTEVNFDVAELESCTGPSSAPARSPAPRARAPHGQQFANSKRLGQIVVRACIPTPLFYPAPPTLADSTMTGTFDQPRKSCRNSTPSPSGSPKSRMMRSGLRVAASVSPWRKVSDS